MAVTSTSANAGCVVVAFVLLEQPPKLLWRVRLRSRNENVVRREVQAACTALLDELSPLFGSVGPVSPFGQSTTEVLGELSHARPLEIFWRHPSSMRVGQALI